MKYIQPSEGEQCPTCYNITTFGKMADNFSTLLAWLFISWRELKLNLQKLVVFTNLTKAVFEGDGTMEQGFHETVGSLQCL